MNQDVAGHPYTTLPADKAACARCAAVVDAARADYSASGDIVCTRCASVQDIEATEERAVAGMKALGFGNIATGALAWLLNPFFLFSIASVVSALVVLRAVHGPWYRQRMSARDRAIASAAAIAGAVVGLYPIRALLFALVGIGLD